MERETAIKAAKWWSNKLKCNSHSNGDDSFASVMAGIMADHLADKNSVSEEQFVIFETYLIDSIIKCDHIVLRCDYGPDIKLSAAAEKAGIDRIKFPWKTSMYIDYDIISVSDGYGAGREVIYRKN